MKKFLDLEGLQHLVDALTLKYKSMFSGGADEPYELISTTTTTEAVGRIDLNNLSLRKFFIKLTTPVATGAANVYAIINDVSCCYAPGALNSSVGGAAFLKAEIEGGFLFGHGIGTSTGVNGYNSGNGAALAKITKIRIASSSNTVEFPAGTAVNLYGVSAN